MQQFITILNVIKKGEGNRPYEALATLCLAEKVLNSICFGRIDNTDKRTIPNYFLDRIMHSLLGKGAIPPSPPMVDTEDRAIRCIPDSYRGMPLLSLSQNKKI